MGTWYAEQRACCGGGTGPSYLSFLSFMFWFWIIFFPCEKNQSMLDSLGCLHLFGRCFGQTIQFSLFLLDMNCCLLITLDLYLMFLCTTHLIIYNPWTCFTMDLVDLCHRQAEETQLFWKLRTFISHFAMQDACKIHIWLSEVRSFFSLILKRKDLVAFKKGAISELLWLVVKGMRTVCLFLVCLRF